MDKEQIAIERLKAASEMSLAVYGLPLVVNLQWERQLCMCGVSGTSWDTV